MFRTRSRPVDDGPPARPGRHAATLLALALAAFSAPSFALITDKCEVDGGDLECVDPHMEETVCVGGMSIASSDPPCGPACRTPGEVISVINAKWVAAFPQCSAVTTETCRDTSAPTETLTRWLGKVIRRRLQYDAQSSCNGNPPAYVMNCAQGDGLAIDCVTPMTCPPTYGLNPLLEKCTRIKPRACPTGNPIQCAGGQKGQHETDIASTGSSTLSLKRHYSSVGFYNQGAQPDEFDLFGHNWRHSYQHSLKLEQSTTTPTTEVAFLVRADGNYRSFRHTGGNWQSRVSGPDRLEEILNLGVRSGWRYTTLADETEEYNLQGRLLSISTRAGQVTTLTYSDASTPTSIAPAPGMLIEVADTLGRRLSFRYTKDYYLAGVYQKRLIEVTDQAGDTVRYEFDENARLARTVYPDGKHRDYLYNTDLGFTHEGWNLLTGIVDENGNRYGTYKYDSVGRAIEEWHGSGTADKISVAYIGIYLTEQAYTLVTEKLGALIKRRFRFVNGEYRDEGTSRCGDPGCSEFTVVNKTTNTYDSAGNLKSSTDYRGIVTDYSYNARGLETARRENYVQPLGCPSGTTYYSSNFSSSCVGGTCWSTSNFPGSSSGAHLGSPGWYYSCIMPIGTGTQTRTTETDWHATFAAPIERRLRNATNVLEAKSQWAYNARGQVVARCEIDVNDSAAMAYTCSDTTAPAAGARVRRWTYAYCEASDVAASNSTCPILGYTKSVNGPRLTSDAGMNGLDDITSYAYYPSTDESGCGTLSGPCHRKGDLHTVTNALGHVTETVTYDKAGRMVRSKDPNGTLTDAAYNTRGWMTSRTIRALASGANNADDATTAFAYDSSGQVTRVTQPDGAYLNYTYDDAHRLTDIVDNLSNRIHYTLDAAGNRIKEETFDSSYNPATPGVGLKRAMSRQYNALGRLVRELNAANAATRDSTPYDSGGLSDGFDATGNSIQFKDGLNVQTQQSFDALNRLAKTIEDYAGTDSETSNATTEFSYDARDNIRAIKDPDGLTTTYTYDGLGNRITLDSPDTGHTDYGFDLAGNLTTLIDARSTPNLFTYDATGRIRGSEYATPNLNITLNHDQNNSITGCEVSHPIGRLTRMIDASGSTTYCYDRRGNITKRKQITAGHTMIVSYTYDRSDRIESTTYPSGSMAFYVRNNVGLVTGLSWQVDANATPTELVKEVSYYPFGPAKSLKFGNDRTLTKIYDNDYEIDRILSSASDGLTLDFDVDAMGNVSGIRRDPQSPAPERRYIYDKLNRLSRVDDSSGAMLEDYNFTKSGDRTAKHHAGAAPQAYTYLAGTHRLISVDGSNYSYDSNGNTLDRGDGIIFSYDDRNRLASVSNPTHITEYGYSGFGERTLKIRSDGISNVTSRHTFNGNGQVLTDSVEGFPDKNTDYIYINSIPVAFSRASSISYIETDHLGTPRIISDATTGAKQWEWNLFESAFGENAPNEIASGKDIDLRYPGQLADSENFLSYNYYRDFDHTTGRFIQSDPIGLAGDINTYTYGSNSPLVNIDPDGLAPQIPRCFMGICSSDRMPNPNPPHKPAPSPNELLSTCTGTWIQAGDIMHPLAILRTFDCKCSWVCKPCKGPYMWSGDGDSPYLPRTHGQPIGGTGGTVKPGKVTKGPGGSLNYEHRAKTKPMQCACAPPNKEKPCCD